MEKIANSNSLARKLTVSAMALMVSSVIIITMVVYIVVVSFGDSVLENELDEKANFIEKAFMEPLWTYDQYQIDEIGNSLIVNSKYTYIVALRIETNAQEVLFEEGHDDIKTFKEASGLPHTKTKQIIIAKNGQQLGIISVAMSNEGYINAFRDRLIMILMAAMVVMFLFAQLVRYYFKQTLSRPLNKILNQIHRLEREEYEVRFQEELHHELGAISKALNQAGQIIEKRNADIMYYTNDLENKVKERTAALENQMNKDLSTARMAAVGEMAADVAHEINNPLTIIDLHIGKLKKLEALNAISPDGTKSILKIQSMILRITKIIKGLKSLSRDGNADPKVPFSIVEMLEDVNMLVEMKVKAQDIRFEVRLKDQELLVIGREVQISQVLVNLVGNAVDAIISNEKIAKDNRWITLEVQDNGENVYFIVTDCGDGIPESLQEKIMQPFFTTKEVNKGTGLGLSISKNIIEEHGGNLEYNCAHINTQFIFNLKKYNPKKEAA